MSEFSNYSVTIHLGTNQFWIKSLNIVIKVVDLIFSVKEFHVGGPRVRMLLSLKVNVF